MNKTIIYFLAFLFSIHSTFAAEGDGPIMPKVQESDFAEPNTEAYNTKPSWTASLKALFRDMNKPTKAVFLFHRREGRENTYRRSQTFRPVHPIPRFYSYIDDIPAPKYGSLQLFSIPSGGFLRPGHGNVFYIRSSLSSKSYSWEVQKNRHTISRVTDEEIYLAGKAASYAFYFEIKGESAKSIQAFLDEKLKVGSFEGPNYPKATFNEFINQRGFRTFSRPSTIEDRLPRTITASLAAFTLFYSLPYILTGLFKCEDFLTNTYYQLSSFF